MSLQIVPTAGLVSVNTTSTAKSVDLPLTSQRQGRVITVKDAYGFARTNPITINATGGNTFEDGTTSYVIDKAFGSVTFVAKGTQWIKTSEFSQGLPSTIDGLASFGYVSSLSLQSTMTGLNKSFITSSLVVSSISFGNDFGFLNLGDVQTDTLSSVRIFTSTIQADGAVILKDRQLGTYSPITLSNQTLYINGNPIAGGGGGSGDVTSTNLTSTTLGLGTLGYLSSFRSISSLAISSGQSYTGQGVFSTIHVNMTPETAPTFDSNSYPVFGSNYPGDPLAVDIFGSLRVLKNLYVGSTTTIIGTLGMQGKLVCTSQVTASSIGLFNPATGGLKYLTLDAAGGLSLAGQPIQGTVVSTFSNLFASSFRVSTITMNDLGVAGIQRDLVLSNGALTVANIPLAYISDVVSTTGGLTSNLGVALGSTITNLGRFGYLSSASNLISSPFLNSSLVSTVRGLGTAGYLSSASDLVSSFTLASSLQSTTIGIQTLISSFIDPTELASTVVGLGTVNFVSSLGLASSFVSTTQGLGTLGYVSSASLQSTVRGLATTGYLSSAATLVSTPFLNSSLVSTVQGLGSVGYLSSASNLISSPFLNSSLVSTVRGLGTAGYLSSASNLVSTPFLNSSLVSTVQGLGSFGYLSSASNLLSTPFLNSTLVSTIRGLGSAGYLSSAAELVSSFTLASSLQSTTIGLQNFISSSYIDPTELTSTVVGLGSVSIVSSLGLASTTQGLGTLGYISSPSLQSTVRGLATTGYLSSASNLVSTPFMNSSLVSTVQGLATTGYLSSASNLVSTPFLNSSLVSTVRGLGSAGYLSSLNLSNLVSTPLLESTLQSTMAGIGSLGYLSSPSLQSTIVGLNTSFFTSSLTVSSISFGNDFGFLNLGDVQTDTLSSVRIFTSTIQADGALFLRDRQLGSYGPITLSNQQLYVNGVLVAGGGGGSGDVTSTNLTSTTLGLGTLGYLSSLTNIVSTSLLDSTLQSTVSGLNRLTPSDYIAITKLAADQTLTADVDTVIQFVDDYDPKNWYDATTYLFTPNVAGYYNMTYQVWFSGFVNSNNQVNIQMRKNGATQAIGQSPQNLITGQTVTVSKVVYFNGSTDSMDFSAYVGTSSNSNTKAIQGGGPGQGTYFSAFLLLSGANVSGTSGSGSGDVVSTQLISTAGGLTSNFGVALGSTINALGTFRYLSSGAGLISTAVLDSTLQSTVRGLGTAGYLSTVNLNNIVSTPFLNSSLVSTVQGLGSAGYISSGGAVTGTNLTSTTVGLGSLGYLSSASNLVSSFTLASSLQSTTIGLQNFISSSYIDPTELTSTVVGLGSVSIVSSLGLASTTQGLATLGYISSASLQSTVRGLATTGYLSSASNLVSTPFLNSSLVSTVQGLGTFGYLSTVNLNNIVSTPFLNSSLVSTVQGLGTAGYLSTVNLNNIVSTPFLNSSLVSTVQGLGSLGYLSSASNLVSSFTLASSLQSTTIGLQNFISSSYIDPTELTSTVIGLGSASIVSSLGLASTTQGLATLGYISSASLQSTVRGLATTGYLSSASNLVSTPFLNSSLVSTVQGLGTAGYLSSYVSSFNYLSAGIFLTSSIAASLISTNILLANNLVARSTNISSMYVSSLTGVRGYISSFQVDEIQFGDGTGWADFGPLRATYVSSLQENTGSLYATTIYVGNTSTLNQIRYWGLFGNYNNTILAEMSTGTAVGAQEFLVFKGSSASDRIRFQTTGDIRFEPQVAAREFSTATALATPTMILQSNLVGIGTVAPIATLDVRGTAFATTVSTLQLSFSSFNGIAFSNLISTSVFESSLQSTVRGLGSAGYISSVAGINLNNLVSTALLESSLQSTVRGLGTAGYLSSLIDIVSTPYLASTLQSTTIGLTTLISSFIDPTELTSTVVGLGTLNFVSSLGLASSFVSTTQGLGTLGYVSSASLQSTVRGLATSGYLSSASNLVSTPFLNSSLVSTVQGLGTFGYLSTVNLANIVSTPFLNSSLVSTVQGLGTFGYLSTVNLANIVSTPFFNSSLVSTVQGLGTTGYLSSASNLVSTPFLNSSLVSTVQGLGTFGYLSSAATLISTPFLNSSLVSTVQGLGTLGYVSSGLVESTLQSTVRGLGTIGYISAAQLLSTTASYRVSFTTTSAATSSMTASSLYSVQGTISSLTVDVLTIGTGTGWVNIGPIQATAVSSIQENTGALYATTAYIGNTSTLNQIRFWGLQGNYNNTILAEISTGSAVGAQEFLVFKGSSASDRIRFQTTGDIRFEPQVAAREFSTATALATPTLILQSNLVGIATIAPVATLDVRGTAFATTVSTQQLFFSSFNGIAFSNLISTSVFESTLQSTVRGLGSAGYLSSAATLISTPFLNSSLVSTVQGLGTFGYLSSGTTTLISTPFLNSSLVSTVQGLGTFGYLSSAATLISTPFLNSSLVSTVQGLATTGYLSSGATLVSTPFLNSSLVSTVQGLATTGYLSSGATLVSTPYLDTTLRSTVDGLGTLNYMSTATLQSTVLGFNMNFTTSSLVVSSIAFGTDFGFLNLGDVQTDTLSSLRIFTSTIQADASLFLKDKQLGSYGNITLSNNNLYINGVIVQGGGGGGGSGDFSTAITSTTLGLATLGYLSSAATLVSTPFLNTTLISINQAYTGNISVNTIVAPTGNFILASTGRTTISSLSFFDATSAQLVDMRANDTYLYFSTKVIGGASVAQPQFITF